MAHSNSRPRNFQTVFINSNAPIIEFTRQITVNFPVDEIILRTIQVANEDFETSNLRLYQLSTDLVGGVLCTISQINLDSDPTNSGVVGYRYKADSRFKSSGQPINSQYTFRFTNIDGTGIASADTFYMAVSLELLFIHY